MKFRHKIRHLIVLISGLLVWLPLNHVVQAQDQIKVEPEIFIQLNAEQPIKQTKASYEILDASTLEVKWSHTDALKSEAPLVLEPGTYILRLFDGGRFIRNEVDLHPFKVEQTIATRDSDDLAANRTKEKLEELGEIHTLDTGETVYDVTFKVEAGPDLYEETSGQMRLALDIILADQITMDTVEPTTDEAEEVSSETASETTTVTENEETGELVFNFIEAQSKTPIAGVTLVIAGQSLTSDEQGQILVSQVPVGEYALRLSVPTGYQEVTTDEIVTVNGHQVGQYQIELTPIESQTAQLTIEVKDQSGQVVSGLDVIVGDKLVTTDENGLAQFELEAGTYGLGLDHLPNGYEWHEPVTEINLLAATPLKVPITLTPSSTTTTDTTTSETTTETTTSEIQKGQVKVYFTDELGQPIKDIVLQIADQTYTSDEMGTILLDLEAGNYSYVVTQIPEGYLLPDLASEIKVDAQSSTTLAVQLFKQVTSGLKIQVQDTKGQGVPAAEVKVNQQSYLTDENGIIQLDDLNAGVYEYSFGQLPAGYQASETGSVTLGDYEFKQLTLQLTPLPVTQEVQIQLVDQQQQAIVGASVVMGQQEVLTNQAGIAVFKGVEVGTQTYTIKSVPDGYHLPSQPTQSLAVTDQVIPVQVIQVDKRLKPAKVTVSIVDETGKPVDGAVVYLGGLTQTSNEQGQLIFDEVAPGEYHLGIKTLAPTYQQTQTEKTLTINEASVLNETIRVQTLVTGATLNFKVIDPNGQPVAATTIQLGDKQAITDNTGQASFKDLPAGTYRYQVVAQPSQFNSDGRQLQVDLQTGQVMNRTIQLVKAPVSTTTVTQTQTTQVNVSKTSGKITKRDNLPSTGERGLTGVYLASLGALISGGLLVKWEARYRSNMK